MFTQYKYFRDRPLNPQFCSYLFVLIALKSGSIGLFHPVYFKQFNSISYNEYLCEVIAVFYFEVKIILGEIPKISHYFQSFFELSKCICVRFQLLRLGLGFLLSDPKNLF